jgi:hypothetical protein
VWSLRADQRGGVKQAPGRLRQFLIEEFSWHGGRGTFGETN